MVDHGASGQVLHGSPEGTPGVLELRQRPGEEEPVRHVLEPFLVVEGDEVIRGDVARVGVDGDQGYPTSRRPEDAVGLPELLGDDGAVGRANRVEERQRDCPAAEAGERYRATVLVHQADSGLREVERLRGAVDRLGQEGVGGAVRGRHSHRRRPDQGDGEGPDGGRRPEGIGRVGGQPFPPRQICRGDLAADGSVATSTGVTPLADVTLAASTGASARAGTLVRAR